MEPVVAESRAKQAPSLVWLLTDLRAIAPLVAILHCLFVNDFYLAVTRFGTGVMLGVGIFLWGRYLQRKGTEFPWIPAVSLYVYLQHGLGALQEPQPISLWDVHVSPAAYDSATILALAGEAAVIAGFVAIQSMFGKARAPLPKVSLEDLERASVIHILVGAVVVAFVEEKVFRASFGLVFSSIFSPTAAIVIAFLAYLGRATPWSAIRVVASMCLALASSYRTSMLGEAIFPIATGGLLWTVWRKKIPYIAIAVIGAIGIVVQPVKAHFREIMWNGEGAGMSTSEGWKEAFARASSFEQDTRSSRVDTGAEASAKRMSEFGTLAYVLEMVPSKIPHGGGTSYEPAFLGLIPRAIWPDKPDMTKAGTDPFAIALGLADPEGARYSTTSVPLLHMGYYEHGILGALGWLFLYGACLSGVASMARGNGLAGQIVQAMMFITLIYGYSSTLPAFLGSLQIFTISVILAVWLPLSGRIAKIRTPAAPS